MKSGGIKRQFQEVVEETKLAQSCDQQYSEKKQVENSKYLGQIEISILPTASIVFPINTEIEFRLDLIKLNPQNNRKKGKKGQQVEKQAEALKLAVHFKNGKNSILKVANVRKQHSDYLAPLIKNQMIEIEGIIGNAPDREAKYSDDIVAYIKISLTPKSFRLGNLDCAPENEACREAFLLVFRALQLTLVQGDEKNPIQKINGNITEPTLINQQSSLEKYNNYLFALEQKEDNEIPDAEPAVGFKTQLLSHQKKALY